MQKGWPRAKLKQALNGLRTMNLKIRKYFHSNIYVTKYFNFISFFSLSTFSGSEFLLIHFSENWHFQL